MKKLYTLFILILTVSFSHAQWAGFNNNGGDNLWNNDANWAFGSGATSITEQNHTIGFWAGPTFVNLNADYTATRVSINATKPEDFAVNGANTLTIDVNNASNTDAISHETTTAQTLTFNGNVIINNTLAGQSIFNISGNASSVLEFSSTSNLQITGGGLTKVTGNNLGEFQFNGTITGDQGIMFDVNTTTKFGATSDVSGFTGSLTFQNTPTVTIESTGTINTTKIQSNGSGGVLTLKSTNVIVPDEIRVGTATKNRSFSINVEADQTFKVIKMPGTSTLNLDIDPAVNSITFFANNSAANWGSSTLNITGFREGVLKFGTDNTSLDNGNELDHITHDGAGGALALDASGNLVYASSLSANKYEGFEFSMYPNPVKDILHFNSKEQISSAKAYDLLGKEVLSIQEPKESLNITQLNRGLYILKLKSENGNLVTRKFIVN